MIPCLKNHNDPIGLIANFFADHFQNTLFYSGDEINFKVYIKCLNEILSWSYEFYNKYYYTIQDWEAFKVSRQNIFHADSLNDFLLSWGKRRIQEYHMLTLVTKLTCAN